MRRVAGYSLAVVGLAILLLFVPGFGRPAFTFLNFVWVSIFGWIGFLRETLPNIRGDVGTALLGLVALVGFGVLGHRVACWFREASGNPRDWRAGWTVAALAAVLLAFVAGIAFVGIVHQFAWLATDDAAIWYDVGSGSAGQRSESKYHLKYHGLAFHNYHDDNSTLPPGIEYDRVGRPMHSWITHLLPQLERADLYERIDRTRPWSDPANAEAMRERVSVLEMPAHGIKHLDAEGRALSSYAASSRILSSRPAMRFRDVTDGLANTILAGEVIENRQSWGNPLNLRDPALGMNRSPRGFGSPWTGGGQVVMLDGSVRFIANDTDPAIFRALATPNGGEEVEVP